MSISKVGTYAFYNHPNLERAVVSAPVIEEYAFCDSKKLEVVDLTSNAAVTINAGSFMRCSELTHLIVRSATRSILSAINALDQTNIQNGDGGVYVPADLLDSYKGATNWSTFAKNIFPIGEYPKTFFESILDPWSTIVSNVSYATDYSVKDSKIMELTDGTKIKMDLVAIDTDEKSDGSGKAKMTWLCHFIQFANKMNITDSASGRWVDSEMRSWLISDILSKIPAEIKSHIVSVKKSYRIKSPNDETLWSDDEIWIPSVRELNTLAGNSMVSYQESEGVIYSSMFPKKLNIGDWKQTRQKKNISGQEIAHDNSYYLRTACGAYQYCYVNGEQSTMQSSAGVSDAPSSSQLGVVFGFCTD